MMKFVFSMANKEKTVMPRNLYIILCTDKYQTSVNDDNWVHDHIDSTWDLARYYPPSPLGKASSQVTLR